MEEPISSMKAPTQIKGELKGTYTGSSYSSQNEYDFFVDEDEELTGPLSLGKRQIAAFNGREWKENKQWKA
jgi:hypothetical protein